MSTDTCQSCGKKYPHGSTTCNWCEPGGISVASSPLETQKPEATSSRSLPLPETSGVLSFLSRLFLGAFIWIAIGALAILSALPYGGGNTGLIGLFFLATLVLPIWAIAGLFKKNSAPVADPSVDQKCPHCGRISPASYADCIWCHKTIAQNHESPQEGG